MEHKKRLTFAVSSVLLTVGACTKKSPPPEDHVNPGPIEDRDANDGAQPEEHVNPGPIEDRDAAEGTEPDDAPPVEEHVNVGPNEGPDTPDATAEGAEGPEIVAGDDAKTPQPQGKVNPGPVREPQKRR